MERNAYCMPTSLLAMESYHTDLSCWRTLVWLEGYLGMQDKSDVGQVGVICSQFDIARLNARL